ncbi:hypothetical protein MERGE_002776 [Pneumocystis wakefieldiae]|uniref:Uncharacterized protein n=1 Tax=Pneumocystis wakefieldiae TaxID=38082 RepID=A0A899FYS5_9ASCO|nr:hypothetical protein MERGE_002776 [Pneumocystis wakefieldiae]
MGGTFGKLLSHLWGQKEIRVLILGLDGDSTDIQRLSATTKELNAILNEKELSNIDLLVFANKQDAPNALNIEEISETLNLVDMKGRNWTIIPTCAITGEGLNEGLDWLVNSIKNQTFLYIRVLY